MNADASIILINEQKSSIDVSNWFLPLCEKKNLRFTEQFNSLRNKGSCYLFWESNDNRFYNVCNWSTELLAVEADGTDMTIVIQKYVIRCQPDTIIFKVLTFNEANKESFKGTYYEFM